MTDHLIHGTTMRFYRYPPKIADKETLDVFADTLVDVTAEKIKECQECLAKLFNDKKERLGIIHGWARESKIDEFSRYFWTLYTELVFGEATMVQRWLRYWLELREQVDPIYHRFGMEIMKDKITPSEIERALQKPIEELINIKFMGRGHTLKASCPFHEDKTPSFVVFREQNLFTCFGCGIKGDSIEFIRRYKDLSFKEAVRYLQ